MKRVAGCEPSGRAKRSRKAEPLGLPPASTQVISPDATHVFRVAITRLISATVLGSGTPDLLLAIGFAPCLHPYLPSHLSSKRTATRYQSPCWSIHPESGSAPYALAFCDPRLPKQKPALRRVFVLLDQRCSRTTPAPLHTVSTGRRTRPACGCRWLRPRGTIPAATPARIRACAVPSARRGARGIR